VLATRGESGLKVGSRLPPDGDSGGAVLPTLAVPIRVEGKVWGLIRIRAGHQLHVPADAEARLGSFAELVATAVSNARTRADLIASRARIVAAADEARRKIERNLHDGTQQRLITLGLHLQHVRASIPARRRRLREQLQRIECDVKAVSEDVRELSQGLHPAPLSTAGLGPALRALARRSPIPVDLRSDTDEQPARAAEIAAYYVISEALTNAAKHSRATRIAVTVTTTAGRLHAEIQDDGVGGADPRNGSGLIGLTDRVEALGGWFSLETSPEQGTGISVELPLPDARSV
jgi:signal transduction histidine kinase